MGLGLALRKPSFIPYWSAPPLNLRIEILLMDTRGDDIGIVILVAAVAVASTAHVLTSTAWGPIRFFISAISDVYKFVPIKHHKIRGVSWFVYILRLLWPKRRREGRGKEGEIGCFFDVYNIMHQNSDCCRHFWLF